MQRVCIFTGSRSGARPEYAAAARDLGACLARAKIGVVYGGANVGLMREVADAALAEGGTVIGVLPRALTEREPGHPGLTELRIVGTMHERKAMMSELADGFVALPGGFGTLDELFEILTWGQLGLHAKPVGLLDTAGFWSPLVGLVDHLVAEDFVSRERASLLLREESASELLAKMKAWRAPAIGKKWITVGDT